MPLNSTSLRAHRIWDGVLFPMYTDDGWEIPVVVTDEVLADIETPPPASPDEFVFRCEAYRSQFEQIASNRFDDGVLERPIRIEEADWHFLRRWPECSGTLPKVLRSSRRTTR